MWPGPAGHRMSDHEDSSDASTSSDDIDSQIVENSSKDEGIDEQLHKKECLGSGHPII